MSVRDQQIISQRDLAEDVLLLRATTNEIDSAKQRQRRLIKKLRKAGLSSRFLGTLSDMSPQTILNISKADR